MTNVATCCSLLLGYETREKRCFIKCPKERRLAAGWRWIKLRDVLTGGLVLGKHTFLVDH